MTMANMNQDRNLFCYEIGTLDWGWQFLQPIDQAVLAIFHDKNNGDMLKQFKNDWHHAQLLAGHHEWRQGEEAPAVFWMPTKEYCMAYAFVFKMDHGGETFVVTPYEMPWLA